MYRKWKSDEKASVKTKFWTFYSENVQNNEKGSKREKNSSGPLSKKMPVLTWFSSRKSFPCSIAWNQNQKCCESNIWFIAFVKMFYFLFYDNEMPVQHGKSEFEDSSCRKIFTQTKFLNGKVERVCKKVLNIFKNWLRYFQHYEQFCGWKIREEAIFQVVFRALSDFWESFRKHEKDTR